MIQILVDGIAIETEREEAPYEDSNGWIGVEDRMPPEYQDVLFFATCNEGQDREIMTGHREADSWRHCCMFYSSQTLNENVNVTHWMELPDYPRIK